MSILYSYYFYNVTIIITIMYLFCSFYNPYWSYIMSCIFIVKRLEMFCKALYKYGFIIIIIIIIPITPHALSHLL